MLADALFAFGPTKKTIQARSTVTAEAISEATIQVWPSHGATLNWGPSTSQLELSPTLEPITFSKRSPKPMRFQQLPVRRRSVSRPRYIDGIRALCGGGRWASMVASTMSALSSLRSH